MRYEPPPTKSNGRSYFAPVARPKGVSSEVTPAMRTALGAMVEGRIGAQQPMRFIRHMFTLALLELIETRGGEYFLTDAGRAALNTKGE